MKFYVNALLIALSGVLSACGGSSSSSNSEDFFKQAEGSEALSGGETTVFNASAEAYSKPSANMITSRKGDFFVGNDFFSDPWVAAPASTTARDGLGPLFNVSACQSCHIKDGRGHAPENAEDTADSLLIRLSHPPQNDTEATVLLDESVANLGDPNYGGQLQDRSVQGVAAEGRVRVDYSVKTIEFSDGFKVDLRQPVFSIENLAYGALHEDVTLSMRVAPVMIGLGLLEVIPESVYLEKADENDADGDGISGRPNYVWDKSLAKTVMGRFGWKAGQPSLRQQNSGAFNGDIGMTSSLFSGQPCVETQQDCLNAISGVGPGEEHELTDEIVDFVEFYSRNLAVPGRRDEGNVDVLAGKKLFYQAGCTACHTPSYTTPALAETHVEQSEQKIFPYTDLLLHDMGELLADTDQHGNPRSETVAVEFLATAREWRTAPLWGIGLAQTVDDDATFLHDGRARTLMEAVLWHGGEAQASQQAVLSFNAAERDQLIKFLESL